MSPFVILILFSHLTYLVTSNDATNANNRHLRDIPPQSSGEKKADTNKEEPKDGVPETVVIKSEEKMELQPSQVHLKPEINKTGTPEKNAKAAGNNTTQVEDHKIFKSTEMESGALLRGVSVVVILTALVIVYMALKTYCGKKSKQPVMVSKYGVRTKRSDIEMTPLPLDEDDEDETLFEVNTNR